MRPRMESVDLAPSADLMVENSGVLDCGICYIPLKPPIFQCIVGHVVCSKCHGKLKATFDGTCYVCRTAIDGYFTCHAMERLVESVRVLCPHATHGCAARPSYHDWRRHGDACPHAPYACPREACGFVGPAAALLEHLSSAHIGERALQRFWARVVCAVMGKLDMAADKADHLAHKDVELVSIQTGVPWDEAIRSLEEHHGDLVQAIFSFC